MISTPKKMTFIELFDKCIKETNDEIETYKILIPKVKQLLQVHLDKLSDCGISLTGVSIHLNKDEEYLPIYCEAERLGLIVLNSDRYYGDGKYMTINLRKDKPKEDSS